MVFSFHNYRKVGLEGFGFFFERRSSHSHRLCVILHGLAVQIAHWSLSSACLLDLIIVMADLSGFFFPLGLTLCANSIEMSWSSPVGPNIGEWENGEHFSSCCLIESSGSRCKYCVRRGHLVINRASILLPFTHMHTCTYSSTVAGLPFWPILHLLCC